MSSAWTAAILIVVVVATGCGAEVAAQTPGAFEAVSADAPRPLPSPDRVSPGRPGEAGGTVLEPVSPPIEHRTAYLFVLGHCGLLSPIDVDGSLWDAVDGVTAGGGPLDLEADVEMINGTPGVLVVIGDEARFRTEGGSVLRLARHDGRKEFPGCD